jgi:hypothetical protein
MPYHSRFWLGLALYAYIPHHREMSLAAGTGNPAMKISIAQSLTSRSDAIRDRERKRLKRLQNQDL